MFVFLTRTWAQVNALLDKAAALPTAASLTQQLDARATVVQHDALAGRVAVLEEAPAGTGGEYLGSADNPVLAGGTVLAARPATVPADRVAHVWTWVDQPNLGGLHQITAMQASRPANVTVVADETAGTATIAFDGVPGIARVDYYRYDGTLEETELPGLFAGSVPYGSTTPLDGGRRQFVVPLHPTERTYRLVLAPAPLGSDTAEQAGEYASPPSAEASPAGEVAPTVTGFAATEEEPGLVVVSFTSDLPLALIEVTGLGETTLGRSDFAETPNGSAHYYQASRSGLPAGPVTVTATRLESTSGVPANPLPAPVSLTLAGAAAGPDGATLDFDYGQGAGASVPNLGSAGGTGTLSGTYTRQATGVEFGADAAMDAGVGVAAFTGTDTDAQFAVYLRYQVGRMWPASNRLRGPLHVSTAASADTVSVVADGLDETVAAAAHNSGDVLEVLLSPEAAKRADGGQIDVWTRAGGAGSWTAAKVNKPAFGWLTGNFRQTGNEADPTLDVHYRFVVWPTRQTPASIASQGF